MCRAAEQSRLAWALGLLGVALAAACDNDYPIAPTRCDDYCRVAQRGNCGQDWPEKCVSGCEQEFAPGRYPECAEGFDALLACYEAQPKSAFRCEDGQSVLVNDACDREGLMLCTQPVGARCDLLCEARAEHCEKPGDRVDCLRQCWAFAFSCEAEGTKFLDCALAVVEEQADVDAGKSGPAFCADDIDGRCSSELVRAQACLIENGIDLDAGKSLVSEGKK